jgi:hypothetical protein
MSIATRLTMVITTITVCRFNVHSVALLKHCSSAHFLPSLDIQVQVVALGEDLVHVELVLVVHVVDELLDNDVKTFLRQCSIEQGSLTKWESSIRLTSKYQLV